MEYKMKNIYLKIDEILKMENTFDKYQKSFVICTIDLIASHIE